MYSFEKVLDEEPVCPRDEYWLAACHTLCTENDTSLQEVLTEFAEHKRGRVGYPLEISAVEKQFLTWREHHTNAKLHEKHMRGLGRTDIDPEDMTSWLVQDCFGRLRSTRNTYKQLGVSHLVGHAENMVDAPAQFARDVIFDRRLSIADAAAFAEMVLLLHTDSDQDCDGLRASDVVHFTTKRIELASQLAVCEYQDEQCVNGVDCCVALATPFVAWHSALATHTDLVGEERAVAVWASPLEWSDLSKAKHILQQRCTRFREMLRAPGCVWEQCNFPPQGSRNVYRTLVPDFDLNAARSNLRDTNAALVPIVRELKREYAESVEARHDDPHWVEVCVTCPCSPEDHGPILLHSSIVDEGGLHFRVSKKPCCDDVNAPAYQLLRVVHGVAQSGVLSPFTMSNQAMLVWVNTELEANHQKAKEIEADMMAHVDAALRHKGLVYQAQGP